MNPATLPSSTTTIPNAAPESAAAAMPMPHLQQPRGTGGMAAGTLGAFVLGTIGLLAGFVAPIAVCALQFANSPGPNVQPQDGGLLPVSTDTAFGVVGALAGVVIGIVTGPLGLLFGAILGTVLGRIGSPERAGRRIGLGALGLAASAVLLVALLTRR